MKWITLFANKAVISALFIIAGSIAMLWGQSINFNEQLIDAIVTVAGAIAQVLGIVGVATSDPIKVK